MIRLKISDLTKDFGEGRVLERVNLEIKSGEIMSLLGPSGGGKTTLLRLISGLTMPTKGTITFNDQDVSAIPAHQRRVGMVFQRYALFPHMNVAKNIAFGLEVRKTPKPEIRTRIEKILEVVRLSHLKDRYPQHLSGGQMQRVAIARTLITEPDILLLDEPLANLDVNLRAEMRSFIRSLQERTGITTVIVTHDHVDAFELSDRVAVVLDGEIVQVDTPEKIYTQPATRHVATFMGASNLIHGHVTGDHEVETTLGRFKTHQDLSPLTGQPVCMVIRDEAFLPDQSGKMHENQIETHIIDIQFAGSIKKCVVEAHDLRLTITVSPELNLNSGDSIHLTIPKNRIWIVPA